MNKLSVHLVTWNGAKYIPYLFQSLRSQTLKDWELLVIDNASADDTVELVQKELINFPFSSRLIVNKENKGFAGGHNQAFQLSNSEYFLILNQDMVLQPNCLAKLILFLESNTQAGAVAPRLMKWRFVDLHQSPTVIPTESRFASGRVEESLTNIIDTLGLKVFCSRRVIEIGEGEDWNLARHSEESREFGTTSESPIEQNKVIFEKKGIATVATLPRNDANEVFGVSGALAAFRRSAVNSIGYLFDESFFAYKEDVDLAYRLRSAGYQAFVLLNAVAYHDRTGYGVKQKDDFSSAQHKSRQSFLVKYHSYKNHLMVLIKNEYWQNYLLDLPWIKWYELKKFIYFLFFDIKVLAGLKDIIKMRKDLLTKRKEIINNRKVSWREMRKWWSK